jgi:acetolactate synthase-1/2/3 large subunit
MTIRLADFIVKTLAERGFDAAFMVVGGMAMHLNDALAQEPSIRKVCCHHEQACSLAAEGYAHVRQKPALVQVTAGPGATNALTGVYSAYADGLPMLVISGQVKRELFRAFRSLGGSLRQIGEQEADAAALATPATKYATAITDPHSIRYELEKALWICQNGRSGPVWLDIPIDVQASLVDEDKLEGFRPPEFPPPDLAALAGRVGRLIAAASRPLFVIGPGLHTDRAEEDFRKLAEKFGIPVVLAGVLDIIFKTEPLWAGSMGALGTRAGNIALQNADLLVFLGVTMHVSFTTYNWRAMGRNAHKIVIEPDPSEAERPQFLGDECIVARPGEFIRALAKASPENSAAHAEWLGFCQKRAELLPAVTDSMRTVSKEGRINAYWFTDTLLSNLSDGDIVTPGNATAGITVQQAGRLQPGRRLFANFGFGPMGYALPAAIGAAVASGGRRVICLEGDGSFMMNLQELATAKYNSLPIIVFIYNNQGYSSIRQSQGNFFKTHLGYNSETGLFFPNFTELARSFGIESARISGPDFEDKLRAVLKNTGPFVAEAVLDGDQNFEPKIASKKLPDGTMVSASPEDMSPFLPRGELQSHLKFKLPD